MQSNCMCKYLFLKGQQCVKKELHRNTENTSTENNKLSPRKLILEAQQLCQKAGTQISCLFFLLCLQPEEQMLAHLSF